MSPLFLFFTITTLSAFGIYLFLRPTMFRVLLGTVLLGHAINLLIFSSKPIVVGSSPIISAEGASVDPLPQAIILTAIVIGMGIQIVLLAIASRFANKNSDQQTSEKENA